MFGCFSNSIRFQFLISRGAHKLAWTSTVIKKKGSEKGYMFTGQ